MNNALKILEALEKKRDQLLAYQCELSARVGSAADHAMAIAAGRVQQIEMDMRTIRDIEGLR